MVEHDEICKHSLFGKNKAIKIAKRLSAIFLLTFKFAACASFPWKLNRHSYGVQFGINCTALDQSKLSNFVVYRNKNNRNVGIFSPMNWQCG